MDMRSEFKFVVNGKEFEFQVETWQDAIAQVMENMNEAGFEVDTKRKLAINELARSGKVTI